MGAGDVEWGQEGAGKKCRFPGSHARARLATRLLVIRRPAWLPRLLGAGRCRWREIRSWLAPPARFYMPSESWGSFTFVAGNVNRHWAPAAGSSLTSHGA